MAPSATRFFFSPVRELVRAPTRTSSPTLTGAAVTHHAVPARRDPSPRKRADPRSPRNGCLQGPAHRNGQVKAGEAAGRAAAFRCRRGRPAPARARGGARDGDVRASTPGPGTPVAAAARAPGRAGAGKESRPCGRRARTRVPRQHPRRNQRPHPRTARAARRLGPSRARAVHASARTGGAGATSAEGNFVRIAATGSKAAAAT
jgi:hypothetical protein